jgi:DNA helicase-2/ATP-dependent DNA helicase PcrA
MTLSPSQQEIVNSNDKYVYVIAGAGSGKTRVLTEYIKRLVYRGSYGEKILALSFSNKAANELTDRLAQSFSREQLHDLVFAGTIHNFCMEIVLQRGTTIGLSPDLHIFETFEDRLEIFRNAVASIPRLKEKHSSGESRGEQWIRDSYNALSKAKKNFMFPSDYNQKPVSQSLYQGYQNLLLAQNAIDFDDILLYAYRILAEKDSVLRIYQRIYKHICIDEAQDLNKAQYELIKILAGSRLGIFMVGDPNQAIYGFNGSSSKFMCDEFPGEYAAKKFVLKENYRSSRAVLGAARKIEPDFIVEGQVPLQGDFAVTEFKNETEESIWIIDTLNRLLKNGHPDVEGEKIGLHQCAVLARNRYVFSNLERFLTDEKIDYTLRVSDNKGLNSESDLFKIFDLGLRLIVNKMDQLHFSELLSIVNCKNEKKQNIADFSGLRNSTLLEECLGKTASEALHKSWDLLSGDTVSFQFNQVLKHFARFCENEKNFSNDIERFLVFNDYSAWTERWTNYCKKTSSEERSLANMMRFIALGITNISDDRGLILSTVHMAKGLEFDVVFIIGLNDGLFPDYRALHNAGQLNEEKHNMFVSVTRARRLCYLTFPLERVMPWGGTKNQIPSRFLDNEWLEAGNEARVLTNAQATPRR